MIKRKYQVFISSTYEDLKEERNKVIMAILQMGHMPIGMEMFNAADEEQWETIARQIDDCDYYVVIVANRYGSVSDEDVSYTEKEYDYARSKEIPVLAFVIHQSAPWPKDREDGNPKMVARLRAFKKKLKKRQIEFWQNKNDLYGKVPMALGREIDKTGRAGWIQTSQARAYLEAQCDNPAVCIGITNRATINSVLTDIGARSDFGAYVELRDEKIREFQDVGITTMSEYVSRSREALEILAFDITKDPEIWLARKNEYLQHNADFIEKGGRIARLFFIEKADFVEGEYCIQLYKLLRICVDFKMDVGLAFLDDDCGEDFVVFPRLGVLKEIMQPSKANKQGASIAFFDDNSIYRFQKKFRRRFNDRAKARARRFIANVEDGKSVSDNLEDLTRWGPSSCT